MKERKIVALLPSHNEEKTLQAAVLSLKEQVSKVVVVSDNSTDGTVTLAKYLDVDVFETEANAYKKAGALNQALDVYLPTMDADDLIFVMDADTEASKEFMANALPLFEQEDIGAVGGVFEGEKPTNILSQMNRNEFARYVRHIDRTKRTMVLSGTSSLIRVSVLREVLKERNNGKLGNDPEASYYDVKSITEDNEMSLAIKTLGYRLASPIECTVITELMRTIPELHRQRVRWYRGALDNLKTYGLNKVTWRYFFQQVMLSISALMFALMLTIIGASILTGSFTIGWVGILLTVIFVSSQVVTVWNSKIKGKRDLKGILLAGGLLPEMGYATLLFVAFVTAFFGFVRNSTPQWTHITR